MQTSYQPTRWLAAVAVIHLLLAGPFVSAAGFFEGFESWTDPEYGEGMENQPGTGGAWATLGCRIITNAARTGVKALQIKGGQVGGGAEPILFSGMKTGGVGRISFWYRSAIPMPGVYFVAYRTVDSGPIQHFPNHAGMLVATSTNWFRWSFNLTGEEWRTNVLQLYIARNATDAASLIIDDLEIGEYGDYSPPDHGSMAVSIPAGLPRPPLPFITTNVAPPIPSGDWWSSILAVRGSGLLSAKPLVFFAKPASLEMKIPRRFVETNSLPLGAIRAPFDVNGGADVALAATGGSFPGQTNGSARVDGWGDFSVRVRIGNDDSHITATLVHGSPYAFAEFINCHPLVKLPHGYTVEKTETNVSSIVIAVPGEGCTNHYALFGPSGTSWNLEPNAITPRMPNGTLFITAAALPSRNSAFDQAEYERLGAHAFAWITNTVVNFSYDKTTSTVTAHYKAQTRAVQGHEQQTLMGLLPLHRKNSDAKCEALSPYETLLGNLYLHAGNDFSAKYRFKGIVPQFPLPSTPDWNTQRFNDLVKTVDASVSGGDLYGIGKNAQRIARLVPVLDSAGNAAERNRLLSGLRAGLENLFSYEDGEPARLFGYDSTWGSLLGYPEAFGSAWALNDHHFQHGMLVYAAAVLGFHDPDFVARYGGIVDLVARDYANPDKTSSGPFPLPWLRHFDSREGHSWATGMGGGRAFCPDCGDVPSDPNSYALASFAGADEESTSECMNSWAALYLWGEVRRNKSFRDMGIIGYTIEAEAIREYVYDADNENFPPEFTPTMVSRIFGDALDTATHFSADIAHAWGIQYILSGPHMTYQGYFPEQRVNDYAYFRKNAAKGVTGDWQDIHMMYRCFFEPARVISDYTPGMTINFGNTEANLVAWMHSMNQLGRVDTNYCSDVPSVVVMTSGNTHRAIGFNFSNGPVTATVRKCSDNSAAGSMIMTNNGMTVITLKVK